MPFEIVRNDIKADAYRLPKDLIQSIASYIDQNYGDTREQAVYGVSEEIRRNRIRRRRDMEICESAVLRESLPCAPMAAPKAEPKPKAASLEDMLQQADAGFTETLL